jgi:YggT family protein
MAVVTDTTERTVITTPARRREVGRVSQIIDYAFWLLYTLLFIRLLLVFFHASSLAGFTQFIDNVTNPFYAPFRGIVGSLTVNNEFTLAIPILIAMVIYGLLHLAINKLLWLLTYRRSGV